MNGPLTLGDKYDIPFALTVKVKVGRAWVTTPADLTGVASTVVRARKTGGTATTIISHEITDPVNGRGNLLDTSALAFGKHKVELEAVWADGRRVTYPVKVLVNVIEAIG